MSTTVIKGTRKDPYHGVGLTAMQDFPFGNSYLQPAISHDGVFADLKLQPWHASHKLTQWTTGFGLCWRPIGLR